MSIRWWLFRRKVARFVMWQWKKMSHLSAAVYWWVDGKINGSE